ncbi:Protein SlyX [Sinobacterium norvegicum]|uniref:Protein SlyX homolog n=1 Tax=Sinobacterium norvegicum TaxID=1641715 RepID=A0ABM9ACY5_9GAMM|nr:SlyX family protein [Sinobacterium norvegicum]CAH0990820.1 Protein SlyX [Sinobacterium norvegicum]
MEKKIEFLEEQIIDLQTRVLFQEDTLQELDDIITKQQRQIDALERYCRLLKDSVEGMKSGEEGEVSNDPPPHY